MLATPQKVDASTPVDLVIANAGIGESRTADPRDIAGTTQQLFDVNVQGVFNTVLPLLEPMRSRGHGQVNIPMYRCLTLFIEDIFLPFFLDA